MDFKKQLLLSEEIFPNKSVCLENIISFKTWLLEGKAMDVSKDMISFANEVVEKLEKSNWQFDQIIHERKVKSKYGEKTIKVEVKPKTNKWGADGDASAKGEIIRLFLPAIKNPNYRPASFETGANGLPVIKDRGTTGVASSLPDYDELDYQQIYYTIIHEMIHVFDFKVYDLETSGRMGFMKKYKDAGEDMQNYYNSPDEQDAWMAHRSREVIDYFLDFYKGNKILVQKEISKSFPDWASGEPEKTWRKNPKIWKKYLNTLYQVLQEKT
jgi:hypothetical protein